MQFDQIWRNLTNLAIIQGLISVGPNFETTKAFFSTYWTNFLLTYLMTNYAIFLAIWSVLTFCSRLCQGFATLVPGKSVSAWKGHHDEKYISTSETGWAKWFVPFWPFNKLKFWGAAIAQWIFLRLWSCRPVFESQSHPTSMLLSIYI